MCPGWVFCPCKPHLFGNEYHSSCCGIKGILFAMELVEGNDCPREIGALDLEDLGKTAGLLLHLCKSLFGTARYIVLNSSFCVLKALIKLHKKGIFAFALIKKRKY